MFLSVTTTHFPATDLGYLLFKNPAGLQSFELTFGQAHVFYPVATEERCTVCLVLDVDAVGLSRSRPGGPSLFALQPYVNDRPYVASSFLSVALGQIFRSAMSGVSRERPDLAAEAIPLEATVAVVRSSGGPALFERLFAPLGYDVTVKGSPLDEQFPEWGDSPYFSVTLRSNGRVADLLNHLYVLLPVLDDQKHYWVDEAEVQKLLRRGEGWLSRHPARELIAARYLRRRGSLVNAAMAQLTADDPAPEVEEEAVVRPETVRLHDQRLQAAAAVIQDSKARSALDLGCGSGKLLQLLSANRDLQKILGIDVSPTAVARARAHLRLPDAIPGQEARVTVQQGSLLYMDSRLRGFDAAAVVEVIEHLEPFRLAAFEMALFGDARPAIIVLTTPNREYNELYADMAERAFRHRDHRFEWTRAEFSEWAERVGRLYAYNVEILPVGDLNAELGAPSQMGIFRR